jgi:hypothetical protein
VLKTTPREKICLKIDEYLTSNTCAIELPVDYSLQSKQFFKSLTAKSAQGSALYTHHLLVSVILLHVDHWFNLLIRFGRITSCIFRKKPRLADQRQQFGYIILVF